MTGNKKQPTAADIDKLVENKVRERLERDEKESLVRRLIQDVPVANRKTAGDAYWRMTMNELKALSTAHPVQNKQASTPDWSMAGGSQTVVNEADDAANDETVALMTANCGVGQQVKSGAA